MKFSVIFDMDGVLIDSIDHIVYCINKGLVKYDIRIPEDEFNKRFSGLSIKDSIKIWNKEHNADIKYKEFVEIINDVEIEFMKNRKVVKSRGLLSLLKNLKKKDVKMAVGTSSQVFRAKRILETLKIEDFFSVVVGAEDVKNHKPSPDVFIEAAKRLGANPKNCVVFEDSSHGIEAAVRAGMKSIAYMPRNLNGAKPDMLINSFSDIDYNKISKLFN